MKRLFVVVILAAILNLTFANPVFAGDPPEVKPGNMPESKIPPQATEHLEHASHSGYGLAFGGGYGPVVAHGVIHRMIHEFWQAGEWYPPQIPGIFWRWIW